MTKDFIKWMCGYAEGFDLIDLEDGDIYINCTRLGVYLSTLGNNKEYEAYKEIWEEVYYPLLLQRAIEGVNREAFGNGTRREIVIEREGISLYPDNKAFMYSDYDSIDQAKEAALMWVMEHEDD